MITRKMIFDGYYKGWVRLIESPHDDGVVCQIGDIWFYFGGLTAEKCKTVEEYKASVDTKTILDEIYSALNDFKDSGVEYQDEYSYYELYLKEKGITEMKEIVKEIKNYCNEYLGYVESTRNECAYTDSIVECIIKKAKELKEKYDEEV